MQWNENCSYASISVNRIKTRRNQFWKMLVAQQSFAEITKRFCHLHGSIGSPKKSSKCSYSYLWYLMLHFAKISPNPWIHLFWLPYRTYPRIESSVMKRFQGWLSNDNNNVCNIGTAGANYVFGFKPVKITLFLLMMEFQSWPCNFCINSLYVSEQIKFFI